MNFNIKKLAFSILILFTTLLVNAKDEKTLTLFVTGQGNTFEEAKSICFRNAIEQAFGVFISSKTEILNDATIKDEIISTSSGNIQKYDIISQIQLNSGKFLVNMNVVVSKNQLISFCSKKAISIEFDGASLGASARLNNLYQNNEINMIKNLEVELDQLLAEPFDFKLSYIMPKIKYGNNTSFPIPIDVDVISNDNFSKAINHIISTLEGISIKSKGLEYEHSVVNGYILDINNNQLELFFRDPYILTFIRVLSKKIRNKICDFEIFSDGVYSYIPNQDNVRNYSSDNFSSFINRGFPEGEDLGLFEGNGNKQANRALGTFRIKVKNGIMKFSYYNTPFWGYYSPDLLPSFSDQWRFTFIEPLSRCFFPFTQIMTKYEELPSERKSYFLFSILQENKSGIVAKHKINIQLSISQLEAMKQISIKPGKKF